MCHKAEEKYKSVKQEYDDISKFANRLEANEAFFTIKTKLSGIPESDELIKLMEVIHHESGMPHEETSFGSWIRDNTQELIHKYEFFRNMYVGVNVN